VYFLAALSMASLTSTPTILQLARLTRLTLLATKPVPQATTSPIAGLAQPRLYQLVRPGFHDMRGVAHMGRWRIIAQLPSAHLVPPCRPSDIDQFGILGASTEKASNAQRTNGRF
jgi:hypothetical protein